MAHDKQYKDSNQQIAQIVKFDYPKKGDFYWNRYNHRVEEADRDLQEKFLIVKK